jgi:hypothetical protein
MLCPSHATLQTPIPTSYAPHALARRRAKPGQALSPPWDQTVLIEHMRDL